MTRAATRKKAPQEPPENFVGRSYTCCRGPRKGQAITVVRVLESGKRYELEAERGGRWSISQEKLHRIFGPAGNRRCECSPLELQSEDAAVLSVAAAAEDPASESVETHEDETPQKSEQPVVDEATTEPLRQDVVPEPETIISEPSPKESAPAQERAQRTLF